MGQKLQRINRMRNDKEKEMGEMKKRKADEGEETELGKETKRKSL